MSLSKKLFTGFAAFIAAGTFAVAGSAQTTEKPVDGVEKSEKQDRRGMRRGEGFGKGMRGGKGGHRGMGGLRGIELSDEQKTAMKAIRDANRPDEATREELKTIMQARRAGTITPEQTERAKQLRAQSKEKAQAIKLQMDAILTPEQRQQIETKKVEMKQRREQMREQRQLRREGAQKTTTEKPID
jgi:P pilus assembly/Cpx signaling pathway, periplasmic inhibitor/zinc-resistance associated protein